MTGAWRPSRVGSEQLGYFTTLPQFGDRRLASVVVFRRA
jgi:hypothetical protein